MVWFRMARHDEALRDLEAVLAERPNKAESRFLRGVVLKSLDRDAEADKEFATARRLSPSVEKSYSRYGFGS